VIYNATLSTIEVFDVIKDPDDKHNLADQMPDLANESYDRLAAWVQYEDKRFKANLLKSGLQ